MRSHRSRPVRILLRLLAIPIAVAVALPAGAASAVPIESFAGYQPQTRCSPRPKPGTLKLASYLQRHYRGTGSLGISRACGHGGTSEHKEGRAFDWAVSVHSARDRGYVKNFMRRAFAADRQGHRAALARRMGIMYLIWNDHIYASYSHFRKRPYLNSGCRSRKHCSATLRHRNHVHISLTRRGGKGRTSWYRGVKVTAGPRSAHKPHAMVEHVAPKTHKKPAHKKPAKHPHAPTPGQPSGHHSGHQHEWGSWSGQEWGGHHWSHHWSQHQWNGWSQEDGTDRDWTDEDWQRLVDWYQQQGGRHRRHQRARSR